MKFSRLALGGAVLALPLMLGSCATMSRDECVAADWGLVGETDGAAGYDPQTRFAAHAKSCQKAGVVPDQTAWYEGFEKGVVRYCTPLNGLEQGRTGKIYHNVCPVNSSEGFLRGYHLGKTEYDQRHRVESLDSRISQLEFSIAELRKKIADGTLKQAEAEPELRRLNRERRRLRLEMISEELDLRTIERDGEIFAANPDMVIPPRYRY
ncbi:DUF2799 domain-containing protein [Pseudohoeflea suaedae]|uniref:DUF2799 domain-containing protein n=1 Tax=Pseudohoeflea suaedae TaxID=877384 RepID=A0A4R5PPA2_9HYPH|nr:DUF2799 domain-containing protein [Pseudohoeflea suaedae]TDH38902.1 DUF2799 domain-containing protein [Pseudohoeflea suaedae]